MNPIVSYGRTLAPTCLTKTIGSFGVSTDTDMTTSRFLGFIISTKRKHQVLQLEDIIIIVYCRA